MSMQSIAVALFQAEACLQAGDIPALRYFINEAHRQVQADFPAPAVPTAMFDPSDELLSALNLIQTDADGDGFICREAMEQVREAIAGAHQ